MKLTIKNIVIFILSAVFVSALALPCLAATESGSITVTLEDNSKNKINGITVHLCQIAELNNSGYYPTSSFESSGISISGIVNGPDDLTAKAVVDYIEDNEIDSLSSVSENGKVSFSNLDLGIWVVFCEQEGKYIFNPYIVFLPYESEGKLFYDVASIPKTEDSKPDEISIYVIKRWDDNNNAAKKRPESVVVELLNGNKAVSSVELSESNGWTHTFTCVAKNGKYSVREKSVKDYKATYSGDVANGFAVTNSYVGEKLPQTGQYWWPIVIMAIAGFCFVLLGIYEIGVKKHDKKK